MEETSKSLFPRTQPRFLIETLRMTPRAMSWYARLRRMPNLCSRPLESRNSGPLSFVLYGFSIGAAPCHPVPTSKTEAKQLPLYTPLHPVRTTAYRMGLLILSFRNHRSSKRSLQARIVFMEQRTESFPSPFHTHFS